MTKLEAFYAVKRQGSVSRKYLEIRIKPRHS
jgi:hypothetical protein